MPRDCCCAGNCPSPDGDDDNSGDVSRREFLTTLAGGAGLLALGRRARADDPPPDPAADAAALAAWKRALHEPDAPRRYRSGVHDDARFPLGGIGTGSIELGADGRLTNWQLFHTLRDGLVPCFFGIRAGTTAKLLQTTGGPPGWPAVRSVEMTGEYPIAELQFRDAEIPVDIRLTAFTPFAPLDSAASSWPIACFVFRVHNPTAAPQTVALGAFVQNPIGYDALGPPEQNGPRWDHRHPNFGGNHNEIASDRMATVLSCHARAARPAILDAPLTLCTNISITDLNYLPFERPVGLSVAPLADVKNAAASVVIWIENAPLDLEENMLADVAAAVRAGATLIWSGENAPLLTAATDDANQPLRADVLAPDLVFEDFENGYGAWTRTGDAFGTAPAPGTLPNQQTVSGFAGNGLVNSYVGGDDTTGRLVSKPFRIERHFIRFLIGGGNHPNTQIRLIVDGEIVRAQAGDNNERLLPVVWDVRAWQGKTAHLEIVDEQQGPWGHVNVDQIVFADLPFARAVLDRIAALLPDRAAKERTLGKGRIVSLPSTLLSSEHARLWGARRQAWATLCARAGHPYSVPEGVPDGAPGSGTLALATSAPFARVLPTFTDWDAAWHWLAEADAASTVADPNARGETGTPVGQTLCGALGAGAEIAPGATVEIPFVLAWHYPNAYNAAGLTIGCHYAARWPDAPAVARDALAKFATLRTRTEQFRSRFYETTLPYWLRDAVSAPISTIRHPGVVFRIANGDVYGWEGSNGCCQPTCTHVWGYAQTLAHLFPDMEAEMRRIDLFHQQAADGDRTEVPSPPHSTGEHPFADGHASTILKAYRDARNHPDDTLMTRYWPRVRAAVDYLLALDAASSPDNQPDGTLRGDQWNTYDNAIHGVNTFIGSYYLAALRAGEEMARRVGATGDTDRFHEIFEKGREQLVALCWNDEYYEQHLPGYAQRAGEYGPGCLSDQLIGQWWAHQLELGYLLPPEQIRSALAAIFRHNWLPDHRAFRHNWRKFAGGRDKGLLICTWPRGGRPAQTIPYVDEVWTGVEYQVAAHMLYEGMPDEAFAIIKSARDRYDGVPRPPMPRNPWNEIECGGHYARALSSWSLLLALSGFAYDGPNAALRFTPRHQPDAFRAFFSGPQGWGTLRQSRTAGVQRCEVELVEGSLAVAQLQLDARARPVRTVRALLAGKPVAASIEQRDGSSVFMWLPNRTIVSAGQTLTVSLEA